MGEEEERRDKKRIVQTTIISGVKHSRKNLKKLRINISSRYGCKNIIKFVLFLRLQPITYFVQLINYYKLLRTLRTKLD